MLYLNGPQSYSITSANEVYQDLHFLLDPSRLGNGKSWAKTMRKACGYTLLTLSFLAWGAILSLPLFQISVGVAAALTTGLIIAGEITFYLGIAQLGKDALDKIKAFFRKGRRHGPS